MVALAAILAAVTWPGGVARGESIDTSYKLGPRQSMVIVAELDFDPARISREDRFMERLSRSWAGPEVFIQQILLDESWDEWIAYQKTLHPFIPVQSLKRIIRSSRRVGKVRYSDSYSNSSGPGEESFLGTGQSFAELERRFFIYTRRYEEDYSGSLRIETDTVGGARKGWNWVQFLMEEDGILSGEEWSVDNFLPRLTTVAIILTLGFIFTEFFRYLVRLGKRTFKRR